MFDQPVKKGGYLLFGSYPQSKVDDESVILLLSKEIGELPTAENSHGWTPCKYYVESKNEPNYAWIIDVTLDGKKYRGVYFTKYRPYAVYRPEPELGYQGENGYIKNTVYWFAFEPIKWKVMDVLGGEALLISEFALDNTEFDYSLGHCKNNYANSSIRDWLDIKFYKNAFTEEEKSLIQTVEVDNGKESTLDSSNPYTCRRTLDKVWLLSAKEALEYYKTNEERQMTPTAYAYSQGCYFDHELGGGSCWLRSPHSCDDDAVWNISSRGALNYCCANHSYLGILPAMKIKLP